MKNKITYTFLILFITIFLLSCQSEYTKLVKRELNSGVKKDSLLFDLKFGDTKKDFFDRCMTLNKKGLLTQGPSNNYAQYTLKESKTTEKTSDIILLFYAKTNENYIITGMDMKFYYSAWAPWNENLKAKQLIPRVKDTILNWFPGNKFIDITLKDKSQISIKVDGNRQIKLSEDPNSKDVNVLIENLNKKYNAEDL
tara:strand:- start:55615 stop:56205 length:591 start_codon:yes stop_codon:yes gene_type:complete